MGEAALFTGDPARQVDASLAPLAGVIAVVDLATARQAISTIVTQGEGAGGDIADSHFARFVSIADQLAALRAEDPTFEPAWPAATNPVMNPPVHSRSDRVHISGPRIGRWLDIGNALYTTSLRCLVQGFDASDRAAKATWLRASFALMRALVPVGQGLASRPADDGDPSVHAGLTFTPLRTLARLPDDGAAAFVAERLDQLRERATVLPLELVAGETAAMWQAVIDTLAEQRTSLLAISFPEPGRRMAPLAVIVPPAIQVSAPVARPDPVAVEQAVGNNVTITFDSARCIHSRHCVLRRAGGVPREYPRPVDPSRRHGGGRDRGSGYQLPLRRDSLRAARRRHQRDRARGEPAQDARERALRFPCIADARRHRRRLPSDAVPLRSLAAQALVRRLPCRRRLRRHRRACDDRHACTRVEGRRAPHHADTGRAAPGRGQSRDLQRHRSHGVARHGSGPLSLRPLAEQAVLRWISPSRWIQGRWRAPDDNDLTVGGSKVDSGARAAVDARLGDKRESMT